MPNSAPETLPDEIEHITKTLAKFKEETGLNRKTLTPSEFDHYRLENSPTAQTIMKKLRTSWKEILELCQVPVPLDRKTRANLSRSLHLLEKRVINSLNLGWEEKALPIKIKSKNRKMRPDSTCTEILYFEENLLLVLDVKLSSLSAIKTVYKYLPIFEQNIEDLTALSSQITFFPEWIDSPPSIKQVDRNGQLNLFQNNNVLYICHLDGPRYSNLFPGDEISTIGAKNQYKRKKKKKLPSNMEVRFLPFEELPSLYCKIAGYDFDSNLQRKIYPLLEIAGFLKKILITNPDQAEKISKEIYKYVKLGNNVSNLQLAKVLRTHVFH